MKFLVCLLATAHAQASSHTPASAQTNIQLPEYQEAFTLAELEQWQAEENLTENFVNLHNAQGAMKSQAEQALNVATDDRASIHSDLDQLVGHHAATSAAERAIIQTNLESNRLNDIETAAIAEAARKDLRDGLNANGHADNVQDEEDADARDSIQSNLLEMDARLTNAEQFNEDTDIQARQDITDNLNSEFSYAGGERMRIDNEALEGRMANLSSLNTQGEHDAQQRGDLEDTIVEMMADQEAQRVAMHEALTEEDEAMEDLLDALKLVDAEHAAQFEATKNTLLAHADTHTEIIAKHDELVADMNSELATAASERERIESEAAARNAEMAEDLYTEQLANERRFQEAEDQRLAMETAAAMALVAQKAAHASALADENTRIDAEIATAEADRAQMRSDYNASFLAHQGTLDKIRTDIDAAKAAVEQEFRDAAADRQANYDELDQAIADLDFARANELEEHVAASNAAFEAATADRANIREQASQQLEDAMTAALADINSKFQLARDERFTIDAEAQANIGKLDAEMTIRFNEEKLSAEMRFAEALTQRDTLQADMLLARQAAAAEKAEDLAIAVRAVTDKLNHAANDRQLVRDEIDQGIHDLSEEQTAALNALATKTQADFDAATAERSTIMANVDANFESMNKALDDYKLSAEEIMQEEINAINNKFSDARDARDAIQHSVDTADEAQKAAIQAALDDAVARFGTAEAERAEITRDATAKKEAILAEIAAEKAIVASKFADAHAAEDQNMEDIQASFTAMDEDFSAQLSSNAEQAAAAMGVFEADLAHLDESTAERFTEHMDNLNEAHSDVQAAFIEAQNERNDLEQELADDLSQSKLDEAAALTAAVGRANEKFDLAQIELNNIEGQINENVQKVQTSLDNAVDDAADALEDAQAVTDLKLQQAEQHRTQLAAEADAALSEHKDATAAAFDAAADQAEADRNAAASDRDAMKIAHNQLANTVAADNEALLARLDAQMDAANQRFENAQTARDDLQSNITANQDAIKQLNEDDQQRLNDTVAQFNREFEAAEADRKQIRVDAAAALEEGLRQAKEAADLAFADAQQDRTDMEAAMAQARADDDSNREAILQKELARIDNEFAAAEAARATIQAAHDELKSGLTADAERIAKETLRINNEIAALENQIRQHEENHADIPEIQTQITTLTRELASLAGSAGSFLTEGETGGE